MDDAQKRSALVVATLTSFVTPFMGSAINVALPSIAAELNMNAVTLSWVATSYLLSAAVFLVPFGRLADLYGRKRIFALGIVVFTISTVFAGLAPSAAGLIAARVVQGLGSAMIFANGIAILTSVYPPKERGRVLGVNVAAVYIGLSVGPFLGGVLTQHLTWRSVFLATAPLGLLSLVLVWWKLKGEWADAKGERFDYLGSIIYGTSITALIYGLSRLPELSSLGLIAAGIIGIAGFIAWEMRVASPVFAIGLFTQNRAFAFSSLAALVNYSASFAITFLISLYLQHVKGLDPQDAGVVLMAQPVVMAAFSPLAGRLSDRIEPRIVASLGMAFTTVSLVLFIRLGQDTGLAYVMACLATLGLGLALFSSPNTNAIMSSVEKKFFGLASGAVGTMRLLGQMFSMAIATLVFALFIGRAPITPANHDAFLKGTFAAFIIFAALCGLGVLTSLVRGNIRDNQIPGPGG